MAPFFSRSFRFKSPLGRSFSRPIAFGSYEILTPESLGTQSIVNVVPNSIRKPDYDPNTGYPLFIPYEIPIIKSDQELQQISNANALAKKILRFAGNLVQEGITTEFLDDAGSLHSFSGFELILEKCTRKSFVMARIHHHWATWDSQSLFARPSIM